MRRTARIFIAFVAFAALAGCATTDDYQPATSRLDSGYSERQIEMNRFQVSFRGDSRAERDEVETLLLRRAADLTLQRGYDHFVVVTRDTERTDRRGHDPFWGRPSRLSLLFSYSYYHPRFGWYGFHDPFWDDPFYSRNITRYTATAEIVMGLGAKPEGDFKAFDARDVLVNLMQAQR